MDLSSLSVKVKCSTVDQFHYAIHMRYKDRHWTKYKTYNDFEELQHLFILNNINDVPLLPEIDYYSEYSILDNVQNTVDILDEFLRELFKRPDTRNTTHLLTFVDLVQHLDYIPKPIESEYLRGTDEYSLAVSDLIYIESCSLFIVSYEEKTVLSKLGRLWSIIEPDVIGCIRIYEVIDDDFIIKYEENFIVKIRCLAYNIDLNIVYVGMGNGILQRFKLNIDEYTLEYIDEIALHDGAILSITLSNGRLYTSGYDSSIRCIDCNNNNIISGGKLTKRLNGDKLMVSNIINDEIMLIGTNNNNLYVYNMNNNPPIYITCIPIQYPCTIRNIIIQSKNIFILHGNCISCHLLTKRNLDNQDVNYTSRHLITRRNFDNDNNKLMRINDDKNITSSHINDNENIELSCINGNNKIINIPSTIRSAQFSINNTNSIFSNINVYNLVTSNKLKQIIASYDECVAIWCKCTGKMLYSWIAHKNEQIHVLKLINDDTLITGGSDGTIKIWKLPNSNELVLWEDNTK